MLHYSQSKKRKKNKQGKQSVHAELVLMHSDCFTVDVAMLTFQSLVKGSLLGLLNHMLH